MTFVDYVKAFKAENVLALQFGPFEIKELAELSSSKFKFTIIDQSGTNHLDFIFNSDFGVRILNHTRKDSAAKRDFYLDMDLDFRRTTKNIFLTIHKGKLYVAVNGLSFADVIFVDDFPDSYNGITEFYAKVDM